MKLTFWGAAGVVTGSMHQLEVDSKLYLLDCGMYQGRRKEAEQQNQHFPFDPHTIAAVLLSHAHIDHSGNLPLLVKNGFGGPIYTTPATVDLCGAMLRDTAKIQESDAQFVNKQQARRGQGEPRVEPLYTMDDAERTLPLFHPVGYHAACEVAPDLHYEAYDAGHILGSSFLVITSGGARLLFSGDLGRPGLPIIKDPETPPPVDYLILESTYGDRLHEQEGEVIDKLADVVNRTAARGGKLIVPAFAVGRVQQLVLLLHQLTNEKRIPSLPIFVDSPLAVNVTKVYRDHPECFDAETQAYLRDGGDPFGFSRLQYIRDAQDSMKLNGMPGPFIVISPSGMCEAGRVLHHLRNSVGDSRNTVLITGYQADNTLGRKLLDGQHNVRIFGDPVEVKAEIDSLQALSGHADRDELLAWMEPLAKTVKQVFLVHGEPVAAAALADAIKTKYRLMVTCAARGQSFPLN